MGSQIIASRFSYNMTIEHRVDPKSKTGYRPWKYHSYAMLLRRPRVTLLVPSNALSPEDAKVPHSFQTRSDNDSTSTI
jgi:hypothetical protein